MSEYPLDEWVNWRWEIKWSRYEPGSKGRTGLYSTTDASLTVYVNKARRVQWTGKLGKVSFLSFKFWMTFILDWLKYSIIEG